MSCLNNSNYKSLNGFIRNGFKGLLFSNMWAKRSTGKRLGLNKTNCTKVREWLESVKQLCTQKMNKYRGKSNTKMNIYQKIFDQAQQMINSLDSKNKNNTATYPIVNLNRPNTRYPASASASKNRSPSQNTRQSASKNRSPSANKSLSECLITINNLSQPLEINENNKKSYEEFNKIKKVEYINKGDIIVDGSKFSSSKQLGSGAYGSVILYENIQNNNYIALKLFESGGKNRITVQEAQDACNEEIELSEIIKKNRLSNVIPVHKLSNIKNGLVMPSVDNNFENIYKNLIKSGIEEDKDKDKFMIDIIKCILDSLIQFNENGLYYTDLKFANLLVLITSEKEFKILFGDLGSFAYMGKGWKGYNTNVATFPPPNSTQHGHLGPGMILPNRRINEAEFADKDFMDKTMSWIFGTFILNLLYVRFIQGKFNRSLYWSDVYKIKNSNRAIVGKIEYYMERLSKSSILIPVMHNLKSLMKYNNSDRITLTDFRDLTFSQ
jgi:hypothetical protein